MDCASTTFRGGLSHSLMVLGKNECRGHTTVCAYVCRIGRLARDISVGLSQLSYSAFYTALLVQLSSYVVLEYLNQVVSTFP